MLNVETAVFSLYHDLRNLDYLDNLVFLILVGLVALETMFLDKVPKYAEKK